MDTQEYLQHRLEEEGQFRAYPVTWTVEEKESGAVAIAIQWAIHSRWHGKEAGGWSEDWAPGYFTESRSWIVGKAVEANPQTGEKAKPPTPKGAAISNLAKCGLWNGDFDVLAGPVPSVFCLLEVGSETFEGKLRYRADWINPNADEPKGRGGFAPATAESLTSLRARFGSSTKAAAGGNPTGRVAAPPSSTPAPQIGQPAPALAPVPLAPAPAPAPAIAPTPAVPSPTPAPVGSPANPVAAPAPAPAPAPAAAPPLAAPAPAPAVSPPTPTVPPAAAPPAAQPPTAAPTGFAGPPAMGTPDDPIDPDDTPF